MRRRTSPSDWFSRRSRRRSPHRRRRCRSGGCCRPATSSRTVSGPPIGRAEERTLEGQERCRQPRRSRVGTTPRPRPVARPGQTGRRVPRAGATCRSTPVGRGMTRSPLPSESTICIAVGPGAIRHDPCVYAIRVPSGDHAGRVICPRAPWSSSRRSDPSGRIEIKGPGRQPVSPTKSRSSPVGGRNDTSLTVIPRLQDAR